jgi:hypothetical protein
MFDTLMTVLNQELILFGSILTAEKEKRRSILRAEGQKLKELTRKSEILSSELEQLEKKRLQTVEEIMNLEGESNREGPLSLSLLLDLARKTNPDLHPSLSRVVRNYREMLRNIKRETEENQRLLHSTARNVERLLEDLRIKAHNDPSYGPRDRIERGGSAQGRHTSTDPLLLNANA